MPVTPFFIQESIEKATRQLARLRMVDEQDAGPTRCAARVRTTHGSCGWDEKGDKKPGKMENPWENDGNWWNMGET